MPPSIDAVSLPSRPASVQRQHTNPPPRSSTSSPTPSHASTVSSIGALPTPPQVGSTASHLRTLSRRPSSSRSSTSDTSTPSHADHAADGVTLVHQGDPTKILMDIQKIQFVGSMIGNAAQGLTSMTTSACQEAVTVVGLLAS